VGSELPTKVGERVEAVGIVEPFLVFSVAALDLAIVAGRIGANQLVTNAQAGGSSLEEGLAAAILDREAVGELGTVVGLDALDSDAVAGIPGDSFLQEVGGGIGAVLLIGTQIAQAGELVDSGYWNSLRLGSAIQRRGTIFTSTCIRSPGCVICWYGLATYFLFFFAAGSILRRCNTRYSE